ncbi:hypothetical protein FBALC1_13722 [Flavobacteriales bacterium ALC-1]|nr:hypothetical protein FBALC1_13722 [Flavobacteriales bacterium ALC-1]
MTMEDDILIDNYLKGLLPKGEEQSFLERLASDTDFNEKFNLEKQLFDALDENSWSFSELDNSDVKEYKKLLEDDDLQNLKKTLTQVNSEFNSEPQIDNRRLFYYLAAASIIIFLGFQFFFNQNVSNQDLYNDYVALNDLPSFVSRSDDKDELAKAQSLFENKKYKEALVVFKSQLNSTESKGSVLIYKGIAQTELGNYNEAEKTFNILINSDLLDAEKGYWYKALLFIKANRVEDAKQILDKIVSNGWFKSDKAEELLKELN